MNVAIDIDPAAALLAQKEPPPRNATTESHLGIISVDPVALSPEDREELAHWVDHKYPHGCTFYIPAAPYKHGLGGGQKLYAAAEATPDALRAALRAARESRQKAQERKRADEQKAQEERRQKVRKWLTTPLIQWLKSTCAQAERFATYTAYYVCETVPYDPELDDRRQEAEHLARTLTEKSRLLAVTEAEKKAEAEKMQQKSRQEVRQRLRVWAEAEGSERLKLLLKHGFDWEEEAHKEYALQAVAVFTRAGLFDPPLRVAPFEADNCKEITEPTTGQLLLLDKVAAALQADSSGHFRGKPELVRTSYEGTTVGQVEVCVTVRCPDDEERVVGLVDPQAVGATLLPPQD